MKGQRPTTASIDLAALAHNLSEAIRLAAGRELIAVVKADAYGHGAVPVARKIVASGGRRLAVATVAEAAELRGAAIVPPILVLGGIHDAAEAADVVALGVTPVIHHAGHVPLLRKAAKEQGRVLPVQLEVDTGMARMGVPVEEATPLLEAIAREPNLLLEGIYTHLACADDPDLARVRQQLGWFAEVVAAIRRRGIEPGLVHAENSAGLLASPDLEPALLAPLNAARPGLMLYGASPAAHFAGRAALEPVMSLRSRISNVRVVRPGDPVGYGGTFRAKERGRIATVPVGYADGIPWSLGNRGSALCKGKRLPIAGRVSMDLVTLDVGAEDVRIGDPVVLFGRSDDASPAILPIEEVAGVADTLSYELMVRVGPRVPRHYES